MSNLTAFDMSAFEDNTTAATAASTAAEETTEKMINLTNPYEQTRYNALTTDLFTLQTHITEIQTWYADKSLIPPHYASTNLGFLLSGLGEHAAKVKELLKFYENIASGEYNATEAKDMGDLEGREMAEEESREARKAIERKEGDLVKFREKYPDYCV